MKRAILKISVIASVFAAIALVGCSDDDGTIPTTPPDFGGENDLTGQITEDTTLDAAIAYELTGILSVEAGATLTIPAGTTITSQAGTDRYIVVQKGAMIDIQGTASNPVVLTSEDASPGDWGGLVICGDAVTSSGIDVTAEVGGLVYGGDNPADNSGSINYLIIEGAGAQINSESQYNGLSLYAVGSGTSINNVAILNGADDGVEFFGGSVEVTNLYLENNEDDAVDWTERWDGGVTNTYVLHTIGEFSTAIEADGENANPTITNFTSLSETGGVALQFKKQSGATITGLSLTGYDTSVDLPNAADPAAPTEAELSVIQIEGVTADPGNSYTVAPTVDINDFAWVANRGTVEESVLQGSVSGDVILDPNVAYSLNSSYIIEEGGSLTIPAGTRITAREGGTDVFIAVLRGATIDIQGTETNPVVMSSASGNPGDWGGLTICGNATTTAGIGAQAEVGGFVYGGDDDTESSGSIKNLVLYGTGAQINSESQYNGISFYAVGSGTTVENIAIYNGADDGVEFFGGTVNAKNIYLENLEDDAVDWTEGWSGTITDTYVSHTDANFSTAVEADGENKNPQLVNFTAVSTVGGLALQFKKTSGATFTNLFVDGYNTNLDMPNDGPTTNVIIDGTPVQSAADDVFANGSAVDISGWTWINAAL
ncbi:hypothetical protein E7Z59_05330 [Robertkochia marina]|uniref:Multidrug transporter n=1 Tax=Robertkochia marina TaxID=1227945 RepID=A0A4S3M5V0_9FLAO|nr:hypothetical protein [Robertkochia marina]THD69751.1 hypothetical protein E7Z59_05330 [Robertkochia marina]TRZ46906.1 hypothetical protein D3A96_04880 [Robertkochia marina]